MKAKFKINAPLPPKVPPLDLNFKPDFKHFFNDAYIGPTIDGKYLPQISKQKAEKK